MVLNIFILLKPQTRDNDDRDDDRDNDNRDNDNQDDKQDDNQDDDLEHGDRADDRSVRYPFLHPCSDRRLYGSTSFSQERCDHRSVAQATVCAGAGPPHGGNDRGNDGNGGGTDCGNGRGTDGDTDGGADGSKSGDGVADHQAEA